MITLLVFLAIGVAVGAIIVAFKFFGAIGNAAGFSGDGYDPNRFNPDWNIGVADSDLDDFSYGFKGSLLTDPAYSWCKENSFHLSSDDDI